MILEVAILNVKNGQKKQFEIDFAVLGQFIKHQLTANFSKMAEGGLR